METTPYEHTVFERLPVFPLANMVLFPGVVLPLHVFEKRYACMVRDVLKKDSYLAIAMLTPETAWLQQPTLADIACVGKLTHAEPIRGGSYNILIQGIQRVRLIEKITHPKKPYECFKAETIPQPSEQHFKLAQHDCGLLFSALFHLYKHTQHTDPTLIDIVHSTSNILDLIDLLSAVLVSPPEQQQHILSASTLQPRLQYLIRHITEKTLKHFTPQNLQQHA